MFAYWLYAVLKSAKACVETGAMTVPAIAQLVCLTEDRLPEEPTSPVMLESVQVTAPAPPRAALRTAKFEAAPSAGADGAFAAAVPPSSAAAASKQVERTFWTAFMASFLSRVLRG